MRSIHYMVYEDEGEAFVTAFVPGASEPLTASTSSHSNYAEIVQRLKADDASVIDLFDVSKTVAQRFEKLSERVSVENGKVYFDGDEVHNALTKQIVRFLEEDDDKWEALVNFFENVAANPNDHSREQLYEWLDRHEFTITHDGYIVGYKGVSGDLKSIHSGPGIVNGVAQNGHLDNSPGNTVEIARSKVAFDPGIGCSSGLHVGTFEYANSFGSVVLEVHVNPRDVVSVPTDCNAQKVRVCRYAVVDKIESKYDGPLRDYDEDEWDFEDLDDEDYDY